MIAWGWTFAGADRFDSGIDEFHSDRPCLGKYSNFPNEGSQYDLVTVDTQDRQIAQSMAVSLLR